MCLFRFPGGWVKCGFAPPPVLPFLVLTFVQYHVPIALATGLHLLLHSALWPQPWPLACKCPYCVAYMLYLVSNALANGRMIL